MVFYPLLIFKNMNLSIFPIFSFLYQGSTSYSSWASLALGLHLYGLHAKNSFLYVFKVVK